MATIKDVAKVAGVSVSAVSKYLNTPENMREESRQRISKAIEDLEYKPSSIARGLRTGKSGIIAIMLPEIENPYFNTIFDHIHQACQSKNLIPVLFRSNPPDKIEEDIKLLKSGMITGAIYYDDFDITKLLYESGITIPFVCWSANFRNSKEHTVYIDLEKGFTELCAYYESIGVKNIAYIGLNNNFSSFSKYHAITEFCADERHNLTLDKKAVFTNCYDYKGGLEACALMLKTLNPLPEAIICESDMVAMGVLKELVHNGINVPEDILVSGCDNTMLSTMSNPSITTIHMPSKEMSMAALDMLCSLMERNGVESKVFTTSLVLRTSTTVQSS